MSKVENIEVLAQVMNCKIGDLPSTYLGLPLGASNNDLAVWNPVTERVEKRLASWQRRYLSKGGKEVLIKSALPSISTYFMSSLHAPPSVIRKLEKPQRDF